MTPMQSIDEMLNADHVTSAVVDRAVPLEGPTVTSLFRANMFDLGVETDRK